jgi:hypothetical protein
MLNWELKNIKKYILNSIGWKLLLLMLSAFALSCLIHWGPISRHIYEAPEKVGMLISGPRSDVGDNYVYFTLAKNASERLNSMPSHTSDPDGGEHRNINTVSNSYAAALYTGYLLYKAAEFFSSNSCDVVLVTSILHTWLLAGALIVFFATILRKGYVGHRFKVFALSCFGLLFIDSFGTSLSLGWPYWNNNLLTFYSNSLRMLNPTLFWAVGLLAASLILRWLRSSRYFDYVGAIFFSFLAGLFNISVGSTLLFALSLFVVFDIQSRRTIERRFLLILGATLFGVIWNYLQLKAYISSPLGQELQHGAFLGFKIKWQFMLLFGFIPYFWKNLTKERLFIVSLLASATLIGLFSESFHLGSRLWLRGGVIFVWPIIILWTIKNIEGYITPFLKSTHTSLAIKIGLIASMIFVVIQAQPSPSKSWRGFVESDKWQLINWIDKNLPAGSIISSADIEDTYLLPIYTRAKPLYTMYGLTNRTLDQELRRYFYNMRLYSSDKYFLDIALRVTQKDIVEYLNYVQGSVPSPRRDDLSGVVIFLELVTYHSYIHSLENVFDDPLKHDYLKNLLISRFEEAKKLTYTLDFAIVENNSIFPNFSSWPAVYRNERYSILRNPQLS